MGLKGRYFSERDLALINSLNSELMDDIIQTEVVCFKMAPNQTNTNIYGESKPTEGKTFFPGLEIVAFIDRAEAEMQYDDFGPNRTQDVIFKFRENDLKNRNFYPETGDVIQFNARYYEVDNVVQEHLIGGQEDKSFSIVVHGHYSRISKLSMVERQT